jgi:hypothetical protein
MDIDEIVERCNLASAAINKMKLSGGIKSNATDSPDLELLNLLPMLADECPKFQVDARQIIRLRDRLYRESGGKTHRPVYTVDSLFDDAGNILDQLRDAANATREGTAILIEDMIDLDQAAALVGRSKGTLRRAFDNPKKKMPQPSIRGGGGKKNEWNYQELKPWLEKEYRRRLPSRPPHSIR